VNKGTAGSSSIGNPGKANFASGMGGAPSKSSFPASEESAYGAGSPPSKSSAVAEYGHTVGQYLEDASESVQEYLEPVGDFIKSNPAKSLLVTFGVGLLLGLLLSPRR